MRGEAESAFLEFREHGRPRAMARVFDLTAQELLLVAANLARSGEEAAELVQQTFLAAMQQRERWDEERALLPWMLGILLRLQHSERRRRASAQVRGAELDLDALESGELDPVRRAEDAELAGALASAIGALPENQRDVTTLRLVHGLEPVEIAHALGRPLETVRTQLRRAKEHLREALPRSLAALVVLEGDGVDALRRHVLGEAQRMAAGPSLAAAGAGWWTMGVKTVASVAVLIVGGVLVWSRVNSRQEPAREIDQGTVSPPHEVAAKEASLSMPAAAEQESRTPAESNAQSVATGAARLACHVLWDSDGEPAAGVTVLLWYESLGVEMNPLAVADGDGLVSFDGLPVGRASVLSDRGGRLEFELASGDNSVELRIPRGLLLEGVVLDEREEPVPLAELWISYANRIWDDGLWMGRARPDGTFTLRDVEPGRAIAARIARRTPGDAVLLRDHEPGERVAVTLHVGAAGPRLRGLVRDEGGSPVVRAYVFVGPTGGGATQFRRGGPRLLQPPPQCTSTDEQGRFAFDAVPETKGWPLWVAANGFATAFEELRIESPETWVEITLARGVPVTGSVRDEEGLPLKHVEVSADRPGGPSARWEPAAPWWGFSRSASRSNGTFDLGLVQPGTIELVAALYDVGETRETVELVAGRPFVWNATLRRAAEIAGVVVDERQALAGLQVSARAEEGERHYLGQVVTDADGAFRLRGAVRASYTVSVRDPRADVEALLHVNGVQPGTEDLELVLPSANRASARIVAHLSEADGAPYRAEHVSVERVSDGALGGHGSSCADGRLETGLLPPGRYLVTLSRGELTERWTIGPFDLAAGETRDVGELVRPSPGRLEVELRDSAGAFVSEASLHVASSTNAMSANRSLEIHAGRGDIELQPGTYSVQSSGFDLPMAAVLVEVHAGETSRATLALPVAFTRWIRSPRIDAGPTDVRVEWRREGVVLHSGMWGLGDGSKPLEMRFGPGHYEAEITLADGRRSTTSFEVNASTTGEDQAVLLQAPE